MNRQEWGTEEYVITNEERRDNGNGWDFRGCLGEEGIDMLSIWCKLYTSRIININGVEIYSDCTNIIDKEEWDVQDCGTEHCSTSRCPPRKVSEWRWWIWGRLLKSGAIRSILDTGGQKSGSYRRGWVPRRKNCPCDVMIGCARRSADIPDGNARTSIIRHILMPMIQSESIICHTNLGTTMFHTLE